MTKELSRLKDLGKKLDELEKRAEKFYDSARKVFYPRQLEQELELIPIPVEQSTGPQPPTE